MLKNQLFPYKQKECAGSARVFGLSISFVAFAFLFIVASTLAGTPVAFAGTVVLFKQFSQFPVYQGVQGYIENGSYQCVHADTNANLIYKVKMQNSPTQGDVYNDVSVSGSDICWTASGLDVPTTVTDVAFYNSALTEWYDIGSNPVMTYSGVVSYPSVGFFNLVNGGTYRDSPNWLVHVTSSDSMVAWIQYDIAENVAFSSSYGFNDHSNCFYASTCVSSSSSFNLIIPKTQGLADPNGLDVYHWTANVVLFSSSSPYLATSTRVDGSINWSKLHSYLSYADASSTVSFYIDPVGISSSTGAFYPAPTSTYGTSTTADSACPTGVGWLCDSLTWLFVPSTSSLRQFMNLPSIVANRGAMTYYMDSNGNWVQNPGGFAPLVTAVDNASTTGFADTSSNLDASVDFTLGNSSATLTFFSLSSLNTGVGAEMAGKMKEFGSYALWLTYLFWIYRRLVVKNPAKPMH